MDVEISPDFFFRGIQGEGRKGQLWCSKTKSGHDYLIRRAQKDEAWQGAQTRTGQTAKTRVSAVYIVRCPLIILSIPSTACMPSNNGFP